MKRRTLLLVAAAVALLASVAVVLVPYDRGLSAIDRSGDDVQLDVTVSCAAPVVGAFSGGGGWFNSDNGDGEVVGRGTLCRTSALQRLAAGVIGALSGVAILRRGLSIEEVADDGDA